MTNQEKFLQIFGQDLKLECSTKSWWEQEYINPQKSVMPQPKTGRWIYGEDNPGTGRDGWFCNQCGHFEFWDYSLDMKSAKLNLPNPCPNCGAKMVEPKESESKRYADWRCHM